MGPEYIAIGFILLVILVGVAIGWGRAPEDNSDITRLKDKILRDMHKPKK